MWWDHLFVTRKHFVTLLQWSWMNLDWLMLFVKDLLLYKLMMRILFFYNPYSMSQLQGTRKMYMQYWTMDLWLVNSWFDWNIEYSDILWSFSLKLNIKQSLICKWYVLHPIIDLIVIAKNEEKKAKNWCGFLNMFQFLWDSWIRNNFKAS